MQSTELHGPFEFVCPQLNTHPYNIEARPELLEAYARLLPFRPADTEVDYE